MLNDFIAKLPIDVIRKVEIEDDKVFIPTTIDRNEFYKNHQQAIENQESLTPEKAIYLASVNSTNRRKSIAELLVRGR